MGARTGVGALGLVLLAILVFLAVSSWSRQPAVAKPSIQPITFPHSLHVQTYKMDCQYCHSDARRSEYAGLPSVARCMGCHKIAGAALDRKSTRLNSSHGYISYAVFCLKK